jgi:hypothetical protein
VSNDLKRKIARLEKQAAKQTEKAKLCNCRVMTRYHNAECLDALLKHMPLVCPVHGFRELGRFWWTPAWSVLRTRAGDDNEFCPCPPHHRRSRVLSEDPRIWAAADAARDAGLNLPAVPRPSLQERNRQAEAVMERYWVAHAQWYERQGLGEQLRMRKSSWH